MSSFSHDEVEMLLHLARDATLGDSFEARVRSVTDHLALLVPTTTVTTMVLGSRGPTHLLARNVAPSELETYAADYMGHDPLIASGAFGKDGLVLTLSDCVSDRDYGRDAFTGEFFPRLGLRFQLATSCHMPDGAVLSLALSRDRGIGDFTAKERQLVRLIYPDLSRAAFATLLQEKVARLARSASTGAKEGAIVFDADGDVVQADAGALRMCAPLGGPHGHPALDLFVSEVRRLVALGVGASSDRAITLPGGGRARLRMDVVAHATGVRVVAVLERLNDRVAAFTARLRHARLTARELEVASLAAQGFSNREIGERLGVSPVTVNVHLGRVFRKSAMSRAELIRALAGA